MQNEAIKKLEEQSKSGKFGSRASVMKDAVFQALINFCRQDEEFARAVVQGGDFAECMGKVEKSIKGNAISDLDAYTAAVRFYFPGAGIDVQMTIDLCAGVRDGAAQKGKQDGIVLSLADFL